MFRRTLQPTGAAVVPLTAGTARPQWRASIAALGCGRRFAGVGQVECACPYHHSSAPPVTQANHLAADRAHAATNRRRIHV